MSPNTPAPTIKVVTDTRYAITTQLTAEIVVSKLLANAGNAIFVILTANVDMSIVEIRLDKAAFEEPSRSLLCSFELTTFSDIPSSRAISEFDCTNDVFFVM